MSTFLLLVGLALTAQLDSRYNSGSTNLPANTDAQRNSAANGSGLNPFTSSSAAAGTQPLSSRLNSTYTTGANANPASTPIGAPASYPPLGGQPAASASQPTGSGNPINGQLSGNRPLNAGGSVSQNDSSLKPAAMMRAMLDRRRDSRLPGDWVTLDEIVAGATSRADQTQRIESYWDLCSSVADYFLGLREQEEMKNLRQTVGRTSPALEEAEKNLAVRVGTAERAARASQLRLALLTGRGTDRLPLPAHPPHCGNYSTRHVQVFAGRSSAEADELSQLIPLRYAELEDACAAVTRSERWLSDVADSRTAVADEISLLRALELLALERRAFVQIARDYNRRIARYVELAAPGQVDPDQLIGMLIKRDPTATATRSSAAPPPLNRQSQNDGGTPSTFAERTASGWTPINATDASGARRDDAITPISGEEPPSETGEHSLLKSAR